MTGSVDHGFSVEVVIGDLTVPNAACSIRDGVATIALMTQPGFLQSFPRKILVDSRQMWASEARRSEEVKGVLIVTVDWVPGDTLSKSPRSVASD
jgi:hypothetical protein